MDPAATQRRVRPMIDAAVGDGAQFVVLTEMFATGFSNESASFAEPMDGSSVTFLREHARDHSIWIAGSVAVTEPDRVRAVNRFVAAGPSGELICYDKRHPFTYAGEDRHFESGDELVTFVAGDVRITPFVCYDLRFADDFWAAGPGSDLFVVVANWPTSRREHWRTLLTARAVENQCYVVGVNRVGTARGLDHSGDSMVVGPGGQVLASASVNEMTLIVDVSPARVEAIRKEFPFLADRRACNSTDSVRSVGPNRASAEQ